MIKNISKSFEIRPLNESDHDWVADFLVEHWGSTKMVTKGKIYDADKLPGFVAIQKNKPVGLITYRINGNQCEIGSLNSLVESAGIGTALIDAVKDAADAVGCKRVWLITTNDNTAALRFYQKRGFILATLYPNAIEQSRRLKQEIPMVGIDGIPLRDEIELELLL
jgi:N-acetylglutamate synthase-like GNAT family acetyltransferase